MLHFLLKIGEHMNNIKHVIIYQFRKDNSVGEVTWNIHGIYKINFLNERNYKKWFERFRKKWP